jgi:hypothetical protein
MGIIAAGVAIPVALIALAAIAAAAALLLWRRRNRTPVEEAIAVGVPSLNAMTISPLYAERTTTHKNELYAGDDTSDMFGAPVPAPAPAGRDDAFRAHTMTWDNV